jgi:hypothetical protein
VRRFKRVTFLVNFFSAAIIPNNDAESVQRLENANRLCSDDFRSATSHIDHYKDTSTMAVQQRNTLRLCSRDSRLIRLPPGRSWRS